VGALAATGTAINVLLVGVLLSVAAVAGDALNYYIGYRIGPKVFSSETSRWLNKQHLLRAQGFYEKHGGKTIIFARFMPIIRTFAPFVAGIGKMGYARFGAFNVVGGVTWIWSILTAGFYFGTQPFVKKNFEFVVLGIIFISAIPAVVEFIRARKEAKQEESIEKRV
jgi:membrane-associated protein